MDIEELNYYFKSEKNKTIVKIEENHNGYVKTATSKFNQNLLSIIQQYFKDVRNSKIQQLCEDELINPVIKSHQSFIKDIDSVLSSLIHSATINIEEGQEENKINAGIDQTISDINKKSSSISINGYINDYLSKLRSFFYYSYESPFVSRSQVERIYTDLQAELAKYLTNETNKIEDNLKETIKKELSSLSSKYKNQIHEFRNQTKSNSNMSEYQSIIEMAGLYLVTRGNQNYIVEPSTNEYHELETNGQTTDNRFAILSNQIGEYSIEDSTKNISIISDSLITRITNNETNERIKIEYGFDGYEFSLNERKIEDPEKRKEFIIMIHERFPGVYKHLCADPFLGQECANVIAEKEQTSKNAAMFIDEVQENTANLLNELDEEEKADNNEQAFISDPEKSIDEELFELEQNPAVKRYIELKNQQEMALPPIL